VAFTPWASGATGDREQPPLYVIDLDPATNEVVVGEDRDLWTREVEVDRVNLIAAGRLAGRERSCQDRYAHTPAATAIPLGTTACASPSTRPSGPWPRDRPRSSYDLADPDLVLGAERFDGM
jgi:hypothetical protein